MGVADITDDKLYAHPVLAPSAIGDTSATVTLSGYTGSWWLKKTAPTPAGSCVSGESHFSHALSSLTASTTYTYHLQGVQRRSLLRRNRVGDLHHIQQLAWAAFRQARPPLHGQQPGADSRGAWSLGNRSSPARILIAAPGYERQKVSVFGRSRI